MNIKIHSPSSHSVWVLCNHLHKKDDSIHEDLGRNIGPANIVGYSSPWKTSDNSQGLHPSTHACSYCGRVNTTAQALKSCTQRHTWLLALL